MTYFSRLSDSRLQALKGKHSAAHPGFDAVAARIAEQEGVPLDRAKAILASQSRSASAGAKKRNPRLRRV